MSDVDVDDAVAHGMIVQIDASAGAWPSFAGRFAMHQDWSSAGLSPILLHA